MVTKTLVDTVWYSIKQGTFSEKVGDDDERRKEVSLEEKEREREEKKGERKEQVIAHFTVLTDCAGSIASEVMRMQR